MGETTGIVVRPAMSGPKPKPPIDGDKKQARHQVNREVKGGRRPPPNAMPCFDCGHVWQPGERRHEYDHYLGYAAEHHGDVQSVCTLCHRVRDSAKKHQTHCMKGHEFTPANTIIKPNGCRQCRECRKAYDRKRRPPGYWKAVNERRSARG